MKKIFILLGHPDAQTLSGHLAKVYGEEAKHAGHEVRILNIGDLSFDPVLHKGYKEIQALEPDLKAVQENISWCDHFVTVYPVWWSSMPSLYKGMYDRIWLPGFAFRFKKDKEGKSMLGWEKLLNGKTARVIVLMNNFVWLERLMYGNYTAELVDAVLRFAGFRVSLSEFGRVEHISQKRLDTMVNAVTLLAKKGI